MLLLYAGYTMKLTTKHSNLMKRDTVNASNDIVLLRILLGFFLRTFTEIVIIGLKTTWAFHAFRFHLRKNGWKREKKKSYRLKMNSNNFTKANHDRNRIENSRFFLILLSSLLLLLMLSFYHQFSPNIVDIICVLTTFYRLAHSLSNNLSLPAGKPIIFDWYYCW